MVCLCGHKVKMTRVACSCGGSQVRISENTICKRSEGAELNLTCYGSCQLACEAGLDRWAVANTARTGFQLLDKDRERLLRSCARECTQDCTRPGEHYIVTACVENLVGATTLCFITVRLYTITYAPLTASTTHLMA